MDKVWIARVRIIRNPRDTRIGNPVEIKEMIPLEYTGFVYDIETVNHHFVGGLGSVLLHNTDSMFILLKTRREDWISEAEGILSKLNDMLNKKIGKPGIVKLGIEKIFSRLILLAKKRYAGYTYYIDDEVQEKFIAKGLEIVRSDTSNLTYRIQKTLLEMICKGESNESIIAYLKQEIRNLRNNSWYDIGVPKKIRKAISDYNPNVII
ncbi:MAG: hypothetical protein DRJ35_06945 [Thermoprotei archaeon]|nr:MAG: hypothetical protein DRJ35_06945 [Thermoprotei archaeon]